MESRHPRHELGLFCMPQRTDAPEPEERDPQGLPTEVPVLWWPCSFLIPIPVICPEVVGAQACCSRREGTPGPQAHLAQ